MKLEYYGEVNQATLHFIGGFISDYSRFIEEKHVKKCLQYCYRGLNSKDIPEKEEKEKKEQLKNSKSKIQFIDLKQMLNQTGNGVNVFSNEKPFGNLSNVKRKSIDNSSETETTFLRSKTDISDYNLYQSTPVVSQLASHLKENSLEKSLMINNCQKLIDKIGQPELDLSIPKEIWSVKELSVYTEFLRKFMRYLKYYNQDDHWKVIHKKKEYKTWSRDDEDFVVRKCELTAEVDLALFEKTLLDFKIAHKWNPMLGGSSFLIL